ncbi:glycoside hydrolase 15 protein [Quaeritorhiza haematococci]|nr:glycoside hydrolase 15 protein [Quaeritorhiza haematococci]
MRFTKSNFANALVAGLLASAPSCFAQDQQQPDALAAATVSCPPPVTVTVTVSAPVSSTTTTVTTTVPATSTVPSPTSSPKPALLAADINEWLAGQIPFSINGMFANINAPGTAPGTVVAATSKQNPPYFFHWTRDAALTLDVVVKLYKETKSAEEAARYEKVLWDFAALSRRQQRERGCQPFVRDQCEALGGPGEVKYNPDGSLFVGPWGRLQNDGPALRASTLIRFAMVYLEKGGDINLVRQRLYDSKLPSDTAVKVDLEYVANVWRNKNFDLWEEIPAQHFFTRMVQRRALIEGAAFAKMLGDNGAANFYAQQSKELEKVIDSHWDNNRGYINEMLETPDYYKREGRNVATVLAVIHGYNFDGFYAPTSDRVLASVEKLRQDFEREYRIAGAVRTDEKGLALGTPFGRYKEDVYDGSQGAPGQATRGNPWFLATLAVAEMYFMAIEEYTKSGSITVTPLSLPFFQGIKANVAAGATYAKGSAEFDNVIAALAQSADALIRRVKFHVGPSRRMAEQYSRDSGFQLSAENLTWSYASVLTMDFFRRKLAA